MFSSAKHAPFCLFSWRMSYIVPLMMLFCAIHGFLGAQERRFPPLLVASFPFPRYFLGIFVISSKIIFIFAAKRTKKTTN